MDYPLKNKVVPSREKNAPGDVVNGSESFRKSNHSQKGSKHLVKSTRDFFNQRNTEKTVSTVSRVAMINLGCARNLVDSQVILGRLKKNGHRIVQVENSDVAIVNTCSFVEEARQESIDVILDLVDLKKQGKLKKIIVAGCLAQRYGKELAQEFKEVDAFVGTLNLPKDGVQAQHPLTPNHFAYLKICESCFNQCSFCAIPHIKGKFSSRSIESVVAEAQALDRRGVKEINIIGQDITAYGMDLYRTKSLARLLKEIVSSTKNIQWIRLLYAFPAHMTDELIDLIANEPRICKYIDMPLQHISNHILEKMHRSISQQQTLDLIRKIRTRIPGASLRTTFIVGFPGETDENFAELISFMKETRFERAGAFVYSREEGTAAYALGDQIPEKIKKKRLDLLMTTQQGIAKDIQNQFLGRVLKVMIDEAQKNEPNVYLARSEFDAPEVDGLVYVHSQRKLKPGDFVEVRITDTLEYDLAGELL